MRHVQKIKTAPISISIQPPPPPPPPRPQPRRQKTRPDEAGTKARFALPLARRRLLGSWEPSNRGGGGYGPEVVVGWLKSNCPIGHGNGNANASPFFHCETQYRNGNGNSFFIAVLCLTTARKTKRTGCALPSHAHPHQTPRSVAPSLGPPHLAGRKLGQNH
jgi:hypothetical protein